MRLLLYFCCLLLLRRTDSLLAPHSARLLATQEDRTPTLPVRPTTFHVAPPSEREPFLPSRSIACLSLRC